MKGENLASNPSYFLVSVSTRENLELCEKYALAGFMNNTSGVWTFSEIREGDFVSFLYGAKAHNLYNVKKKEAIENANKLPPWKPITFRESGITYNFPFRLQLEQIRQLEESLVRTEFAYVAENLLLRGGYRKTHFQADQTTLQNASEMGKLFKGETERLKMPRYTTFIPRFTKNRTNISRPKVFLFNEAILQAALRQYLSEYRNLKEFLRIIDVNIFDPTNLEVLGEKAIPQGHIDILVKEAVPKGSSQRIIIEVKKENATEKDFAQLDSYVNEIGAECVAGILIASRFSKKAINRFGRKFIPLRYSFVNPNLDNVSFDEWKDNIKVSRFSELKLNDVIG
jgi:hypothetical protein